MAKIGEDQLLEPKPLQFLSQLNADTRLERHHLGPTFLILERASVFPQTTRHRVSPILPEVMVGLKIMQRERENPWRPWRSPGIGWQGMGYAIDVNLITHSLSIKRND